MSSDRHHILELFQLLHHLNESGIVFHPQPKATPRIVPTGQAQNAIDIENSSSEQAAYMHHRPGVILQCQLQNRIGLRLLLRQLHFTLNIGSFAAHYHLAVRSSWRNHRKHLLANIDGGIDQSRSRLPQRFR